MPRHLSDYGKKYRHGDQDIDQLRSTLVKNPTVGIHLGAGLYKIRLTSSDMAKGKSGAFRVIYYLWLGLNTIVLLDLYAKGEKEDVPVSELKKILEDFLKME